MKANPRVRIFAPETAFALKDAEGKVLHGISMVAGGIAITVVGVPYMKVMLAYGVVTTLHSAVSYSYVSPGPNLMKFASWYQMASTGHSDSPMNPLTPSEPSGILSRPILPVSETPSPWSFFSS